MIYRTCLLFLLALACSTAVGQVHRSDNGMGGALVLPYWTTANGNDTLLSIRNESEEASVAKIRILDGEGSLLRSFNLYLDGRAAWAGGFTLVEESALLLPLETGCFLPADIASDTFFSSPAIPVGDVRGSIEVIEMARATEDSEWVSSGQWDECGALSEAFESGSWGDTPNAGLSAPAQGLSASVSLINVPVGAMNVVAATALGGFSDVAQHTHPDEVGPDLANAVDSGAPEGGTRSLVCISTGCRTDEWDTPIEAVAAALTVSSMRVDYSVAEHIAGEFEWMIHRPLERYESEDGGYSVDAPPTLSIRTRDGMPPDTGDICITPPPWQPPCGGFEFPVDRGLVHQNLAFNAESADTNPVIDSPILGHPTVVRPAFVLGDAHSAEYHEGTAEFRFDAEGVAIGLVAGDGTVFIGEPLVSFAVQQYTNGTLVDPQGQPVLANYRGTELPRRILRLESSD